MGLMGLLGCQGDGYLLPNSKRSQSQNSIGLLLEVEDFDRSKPLHSVASISSIVPYLMCLPVPCSKGGSLSV